MVFKRAARVRRHLPVVVRTGLPNVFAVAGLFEPPFHVNENCFRVEVDLAITAAREDDRIPQPFTILGGEEDTTFLIDVVFVLAAEHFVHLFSVLEEKMKKSFWMLVSLVLVLSMLQEKKISAEEAARLLEALERR